MARRMLLCRDVSDWNGNGKTVVIVEIITKNDARGYQAEKQPEVRGTSRLGIEG